MTDTVLDTICSATRLHVAQQKRTTSLADMIAKARSVPPAREFTKNLSRTVDRIGTALITEIKKASPSAGIIRTPFVPASCATAYEEADAACLSVLTDIAFFQGCNDDLLQARSASRLPVLRKDFMIDPWQIIESRAIGADCILIIMAAVDDSLAQELHATARDYGMDILIEVHDERELDRALRLPSGLIGINNRNLKTLETSLDTSERLAPLIPKDRDGVGESGIKSHDDIVRLKKCGIHRFLVGESLLKQTDLTTATKRLLGT